MKFEHRPYADAAIRHLRVALPEHRRVLAVSPTGSGKTVIAAQLIDRERRWRRVLWLAHRYELVDQAYRTLRSLGADAGVVMASDRALNGGARVNLGARVTVASVQTIAARGVPEGVDLIVFDEAHRTMADGYRAIAASCPDAEILGITATPIRMGTRRLGDFYRHLHIMAKPSDLYADGYLARPRTFSAPADVLTALSQSLRGIRVARGDYTARALSRAIDKDFLIGRIVDEAVRLAPGVPKVVFACSVAHSQRIAANFLAAGIRAAHLDATTEPELRESVLCALGTGEIEVVTNVDVVSEGWDLPELAAVIVARPTRSLGRFLQMVGRVQRAFRGKVPIVIDHGANVQRLGVVPGQDIEWRLTSADEVADNDTPMRVCPDCEACIPSGARTCPSCDYVPGVGVAPSTMREELAVQLREVSPRQTETPPTSTPRMVPPDVWSRLCDLAVEFRAPRNWVDQMLAAYGPDRSIRPERTGGERGSRGVQWTFGIRCPNKRIAETFGVSLSVIERINNGGRRRDVA